MFFCGMMTLFLFSTSVFGKDVKLPEEELARESVLPVFDQTRAVLNRKIKTAGRFEVGPLGGLALNEPFYDPINFGLNLSYHLDEIHGFNFTYQAFSGEQSKYGKQIDKEIGIKSGGSNLVYAPRPEYLTFLNYQWTGYYGKLSLTKNFTTNLALFFTGGLGLYGFGGDIFPVVGAGFGQKLYFTKRFALRTDLRLHVYNGPNVLDDKEPGTLSNATSELKASDFNNDIFFSTMLGVSAVFLL